MKLEEAAQKMEKNEKTILDEIKDEISANEENIDYQKILDNLTDKSKKAVEKLVKLDNSLKNHPDPEMRSYDIRLKAKGYEYQTNKHTLYNVDIGLNHGFNIDYHVMELVKLASNQRKEGGKYRRKTSKSRKSGKKAKKSKRKTKSKRRSRK